MRNSVRCPYGKPSATKERYPACYLIPKADGACTASPGPRSFRCRGIFNVRIPSTHLTSGFRPKLPKGLQTTHLCGP